MITIKVILPSFSAAHSICREVSLNLETGAMKKFLTSLKAAFPLITDELYTGDTLNSNYLLAVNNEMVSQTEEYTLKDGDEITFLFAIAGG